MPRARWVFAGQPGGIRPILDRLVRRRMQMNRPHLLYAAAAALVLGGCAAQEGVRPKWTLQASDFAPITPQTTKEEVERRVGRPFLTTFFPRLEEEGWDDRYRFGVQT